MKTKILMAAATLAAALASPALAASMVALRASRLVCAAMPEIRLITVPIRSAPSPPRSW